MPVLPPRTTQPSMKIVSLIALIRIGEAGLASHNDKEQKEHLEQADRLEATLGADKGEI